MNLKPDKARLRRLPSQHTLGPRGLLPHPDPPLALYSTLGAQGVGGRLDAKHVAFAACQVTLHYLAVLTKIFNFVFGPPSPGGSRGRVRIVIFLGKSKVLDRFRPESWGNFDSNFYCGLKRSWD